MPALGLSENWVPQDQDSIVYHHVPHYNGLIGGKYPIFRPHPNLFFNNSISMYIYIYVSIS